MMTFEKNHNHSVDSYLIFQRWSIFKTHFMVLFPGNEMTYYTDFELHKFDELELSLKEDLVQQRTLLKSSTLVIHSMTFMNFDK